MRAVGDWLLMDMCVREAVQGCEIIEWLGNSWLHFPHVRKVAVGNTRYSDGFAPRSSVGAELEKCEKRWKINWTYRDGGIGRSEDGTNKARTIFPEQECSCLNAKFWIEYSWHPSHQWTETTWRFQRIRKRWWKEDNKTFFVLLVLGSLLLEHLTVTRGEG